MENWYNVLNLTNQASDKEIKAAYRKLAKENHPDAFPGDRVRAERFRVVSEAYRVLSDPQKRRAYDEQLAKRSAAAGKENKQPRDKQRDSRTADFDIRNMHKSFEQFFGFHPETKEVVNEQKLKPETKNPLDAAEMFEQFMGIKR